LKKRFNSSKIKDAGHPYDKSKKLSTLSQIRTKLSQQTYGLVKMD